MDHTRMRSRNTPTIRSDDASRTGPVEKTGTLSKCRADLASVRNGGHLGPIGTEHEIIEALDKLVAEGRLVKMPICGGMVRRRPSGERATRAPRTPNHYW